MKLALAAALAGAAFAPIAGSQILNRALRNPARQIRTVLVLPADVSVVRSGFSGSRAAPVEAERIAELLHTSVAAELRDRGVAVLTNPPAGSLTEEGRYALADLQRKYDTVSLQLLAKPGAIARGRYSLGDGVAVYAPPAGADAMAFIRGRGGILSPSGHLVAWFSTFRAHITFVDARSGDVLALARVNALGNMAKKPEDLVREWVRLAFRGLPLPLTPHEADRNRRAQAR